MPVGTGDIDVPHAKLRSLYDFWCTRAGDRPLPSRLDFLPEEFAPWMGHIAIADVKHPSLEMTFSLFGAAFVYVNNMDLTGRPVAELPALVSAMILADYRGCVESRQPLYTCRQSVNRDWTHIHRIVLPCSSNGEQVDKLIVGLYTEGGKSPFSG
ncbi:PAS domain-containing protein [Oceanibaculum sp.]|uniref:PAS domain-containing protein n=1 Tax=Oceanibaculum sp. TaxID=1903597 RepID=UPI00258D4D11|nr:PAS domain-containing protein [Oceanibaculum sp.]MCH2393944.1 PAS domain-containing protein [Oceanibaculum sp.]